MRRAAAAAWAIVLLAPLVQEKCPPGSPQMKHAGSHLAQASRDQPIRADLQPILAEWRHQLERSTS